MWNSRPRLSILHIVAGGAPTLHFDGMGQQLRLSQRPLFAIGAVTVLGSANQEHIWTEHPSLWAGPERRGERAVSGTSVPTQVTHRLGLAYFYKTFYDRAIAHSTKSPGLGPQTGRRLLEPGPGVGGRGMPGRGSGWPPRPSWHRPLRRPGSRLSRPDGGCKNNRYYIMVHSCGRDFSSD